MKDILIAAQGTNSVIIRDINPISRRVGILLSSINLRRYDAAEVNLGLGLKAQASSRFNPLFFYLPKIRLSIFYLQICN